MNLIGHYACALPCPSSQRLGAVLPDLLGMYRRKLRPHQVAAAWDAGGASPAGVAGLLAGMRFHHAVDASFHHAHAALFRDTAAALQAQLLAASRTPGLKRFLPAHVLAELYFDHLLMQRDPGLSGRFHRELGEGRALLSLFVGRHPRADGVAFRAFLERVLAERFVQDYRTYTGILYRMNRILSRFGQRSLEPAEEGAVADWFQEHAETVSTRLHAFVAAMRRRSAGGEALRGAGNAGPHRAARRLAGHSG